MKVRVVSGQIGPRPWLSCEGGCGRRRLGFYLFKTDAELAFRWLEVVVLEFVPCRVAWRASPFLVIWYTHTPGETDVAPEYAPQYKIIEAPLISRQITPRDIDARLGGFLPEIDDDEPALIIFWPAPGKNILAALVVGPAATLKQAPFTARKRSRLTSFSKRP